MNATKLVRCGVMIIMAGMPRTGSTWQMAMVRSAANVLNISIAHSGYWDYAAHAKMSHEKTEAYYRHEYSEWEKLTEDSVLLYKSHEYNPVIPSKCKRQIIFTSHRCLEDQLGSFVAAFKVANTTDNILNVLHSSAYHYDMWRKHNALDLDYHLARQNSFLASNIIGRWKALNFGITVGAPIRVPGHHHRGKCWEAGRAQTEPGNGWETWNPFLLWRSMKKGGISQSAPKPSSLFAPT
eukprot:FR736891.1.p1 GENE.FR736891.1~~FR736891.1.p1  ORF type:complete len:238 (+),score=16.50 FR736891.1:350-1063(+)